VAVAGITVTASNRRTRPTKSGHCFIPVLLCYASVLKISPWFGVRGSSYGTSSKIDTIKNTCHA
jgi:hypothetical protein